MSEAEDQLLFTKRPNCIRRARPAPAGEAVAKHKEILRDGVQEQGGLLRAVEIAVAEVAEAFDGEDPAVPSVREIIDKAKAKLEEVREGAESYVGPLAQEEPDEGAPRCFLTLLTTGRSRAYHSDDWWRSDERLSPRDPSPMACSIGVGACRSRRAA